MQLLRAGIWISVLLPISANAGEIYGTIRQGNNPVVGRSVYVSCGTRNSSPVTLNRYGSYRILAPAQGSCSLHMDGLQIGVQSYQRPARYDLEIRNVNGQARLVRR